VIASGGMASVHLGRMTGQVGFARTVAIKRLHANFASDPEFVAMLMDEARLAARVRHPNVVSTLDIVAEGREVLLVMEYVAGASLMQLLNATRAAQRPPPVSVVCDLMVGVLNGLHAAHEATDEHGSPLQIVHRDVSPHNILVGTDGVARVLDFGIAKAVGRSHQTRGAQVKGKLRYMPAEQMLSQKVTRVADVYSAAVVLWEALTSQRLFDGDNDAQVMMRVLNGSTERPSSLRRDIPPALDEIVLRGLRREPSERFPTAKAMALALEAAVPPVTRSTIIDWVMVTVGDQIGKREEHVAAVERSSGSDLGTSESRIYDLPRSTLPATPPEPATLSRAGSLSRSVSPASRHSVVLQRRFWSAIAATAAAALLLGVSLAWGLRGGAAAPDPARSVSTNVSVPTAAAPPAPVSPDSPPALPVTPTEPPAATTATATPAPVSSALPASPAASATSDKALATIHKPKRVVSFVAPSKAPPPPNPARIYKRD
jgi:eukaryotic-like serine/threonine-protein kinase